LLPAAGPRALLAPAAIAVAVLAASGWLAEPRVGYLAACVLATACGAFALRWYARGPARGSLVIAVAALAIVAAVCGRAQWRFARFTRAPAEVGSREAADQRGRLALAVDGELRTLRHVAQQARYIPAEAPAAMAALEHYLKDVEHRAALVYRGDSLVAWAGTLHADPRALVASSGVVQTPFGLTLYVVEDSAAVRVVAASLLHAASRCSWHCSPSLSPPHGAKAAWSR
jgi:hypothetical protein